MKQKYTTELLSTSVRCAIGRPRLKLPLNLSEVLVDICPWGYHPQARVHGKAPHVGEPVPQAQAPHNCPMVCTILACARHAITDDLGGVPGLVRPSAAAAMNHKKNKFNNAQIHVTNGRTISVNWCVHKQCTIFCGSQFS